jgi:predicted GIY-YIG superfamily endonuclease
MAGPVVRKICQAVPTAASTRLAAHNGGRVAQTSSGKPWIIDVVVEFSDERRAIALEKNLKSGSGAAFAKRHLPAARIQRADGVAARPHSGVRRLPAARSRLEGDREG